MRVSKPFSNIYVKLFQFAAFHCDILVLRNSRSNGHAATDTYQPDWITWDRTFSSEKTTEERLWWGRPVHNWTPPVRSTQVRWSCNSEPELVAFSGTSCLIVTEGCDVLSGGVFQCNATLINGKTKHVFVTHVTRWKHVFFASLHKYFSLMFRNIIVILGVLGHGISAVDGPNYDAKKKK